MKNITRYLGFTAILVLTLIWKMNTWSDSYAQVDTFRGAQLEEDVFDPMMAANLNDSGALSVYMDDIPIKSEDKNILLSNKMNPVMSIDFIREYFGVCCFRESENAIVLQVKDNIYEFFVDNPTGIENGDDFQLTSSPVIIGDKLYIGIEDLCRCFGLEYYYDNNDYYVSINGEFDNSLPEYFDLRDYGRVSEIKNQQSLATCWACASLEALESGLLPYTKKTFSVDHMISANNFNKTANDGGDYTMAVAYLLAWQGPIGDTDDETDFHVQEVHFVDSEDQAKIKREVFAYGGVSTSIYANLITSNLAKSNYYNLDSNSYYFPGEDSPNHDVVIVGWDDNYPAEKFSIQPPGNGAFICQNSWGSGFGDEGIFYISYYDTNIGNQSVSYVKIEGSDNYDHIYQSDLCGWIGQVGYNKDSIMAANVFTAGNDENVEAAGFYVLAENTSYQLYFVDKFDSPSSLAKRTPVAAGTFANRGYYTVKFDTPKAVTEGQKFAIVLAIDSPGTTKPMALEYIADSMSENVNIEDGEGYISVNGLNWDSVEDSSGANLCLKAYSKNAIDYLN